MKKIIALVILISSIIYCIAYYNNYKEEQISTLAKSAQTEFDAENFDLALELYQDLSKQKTLDNAQAKNLILSALMLKDFKTLSAQLKILNNAKLLDDEFLYQIKLANELDKEWVCLADEYQVNPNFADENWQTLNIANTKKIEKYIHLANTMVDRTKNPKLKVSDFEEFLQGHIYELLAELDLIDCNFEEAKTSYQNAKKFGIENQDLNSLEDYLKTDTFENQKALYELSTKHNSLKAKASLVKLAYAFAKKELFYDLAKEYLKENKDDKDIQHLLIKQNLNDTKYDEVKKLCEEFLLKDKFDGFYDFYLARAYEAQGDLDKAKTSYQNATIYSKGNPLFYRYYGYFLIKNNMHNLGDETINELLRNPNRNLHSIAYELIGDILMKSKNPKAIAYYDKAVLSNRANICAYSAIFELFYEDKNKRLLETILCIAETTNHQAEYKLLYALYSILDEDQTQKSKGQKILLDTFYRYGKDWIYRILDELNFTSKTQFTKEFVDKEVAIAIENKAELDKIKLRNSENPNYIPKEKVLPIYEVF